MAEDTRDLIITKLPYVKQILVDALNNYLRTDVYTDGLFGDNFKNIRVSEDHPFATLVASQMGISDTTKGATDLFPSVTVVVTEDRYAADRALTAPILQANVGLPEIAHMTSYRKTQYVMSTTEIDRIQSAYDIINPNPSAVQVPISFEGIEQAREAEVAIEIWSRNSQIKDRLFDLVIAFFASFGRLSLREDYSIIVDNGSLAGERDGVYNFDFGYKLSGAMIKFKLDYNISQYRSTYNPVIGAGAIVDVNDAYD